MPYKIFGLLLRAAFATAVCLSLLVGAVSANAAWDVQVADAPEHFVLQNQRALAIDPTTGDLHMVYGYDHLYHSYNSGSGWVHETIDGSSGVGMHASLAIDPSGTMHVAYFDSINDEVKYATGTTGSWSIDTVATGVDAFNSTYIGLNYLSIACDSSGVAHFAYYNNADSTLYHADNSSGWSVTPIDSNGWFPAIAVDSNGYPHISYYDTVNSDQDYAHKDGTGWHLETIASTGEIGGCSSIWLDGSDVAHVAYNDNPNGKLMYATNPGGTWASEIAGSLGWNESGSIVVDGTGDVHISAGLYYYTNSGGSWSSELYDDSFYMAGVVYCSLALDSSGYAHIGYFAQGQSDMIFTRSYKFGLGYANNSSGSWSTVPVRKGRTAGGYPTVAVDQFKSAHAGYRSNIMTATYATNEAGAWNISEVTDRLGKTLTSSNMAVDSAGNVHLLFLSDNDGIWYATDETGDWTIECIGAGYFLPSLTLDGTDNVHVGYSNFDYGDEPITPQLHYTVKSGGKWTDNVVYSGLSGQVADIEVGADGKVRILLHCSDGLYYLTDATGVWTDDQINSISDQSIPVTCSMAIDGLGKAHVAYRNYSTAEIVYANNSLGTWDYTTVATGITKTGTSIGLDASGYVHITYQDGATNELRHVTNELGGWNSDVIDSAGHLGFMNSLVFDADGNMHVAYYDQSNADLKYATTFAGTGRKLAVHVNPQGAGMVSLNPRHPGAYYSDSEQVSVSVNPRPGWSFVNWSGAASGTANPLDVTMDSDKDITANLSRYGYHLRALPSYPSTVSFDMSPSAPGNVYSSGETVWVTAITAPGYGKNGVDGNVYWNGDVQGDVFEVGNPVLLVMDEDRELYAYAERTSWLLSADTDPPGMGTFSFSPTSPDGYYSPGTDVWVTVTPDAGTVFTNWSGAATGTANPVMVTMDADKALIAKLTDSTMPSAIWLPPGNDPDADGLDPANPIKVRDTGECGTLQVKWAKFVDEDLEGYLIKYGLSATSLNKSVNVAFSNFTGLDYCTTDLPDCQIQSYTQSEHANEYYVEVYAYDIYGNKSDPIAFRPPATDPYPDVTDFTGTLDDCTVNIPKPAAVTFFNATTFSNSSTVAQALLQWTPSPDPNVVGYRIFRNMSAFPSELDFYPIPESYMIAREPGTGDGWTGPRTTTAGSFIDADPTLTGCSRYYYAICPVTCDTTVIYGFDGPEDGARRAGRYGIEQYSFDDITLTESAGPSGLALEVMSGYKCIYLNVEWPTDEDYAYTKIYAVQGYVDPVLALENLTDADLIPDYGPGQPKGTFVDYGTAGVQAIVYNSETTDLADDAVPELGDSQAYTFFAVAYDQCGNASEVYDYQETLSGSCEDDPCGAPVWNVQSPDVWVSGDPSMTELDTSKWNGDSPVKLGLEWTDIDKIDIETGMDFWGYYITRDTTPIPVQGTEGPSTDVIVTAKYFNKLTSDDIVEGQTYYYCVRATDCIWQRVRPGHYEFDNCIGDFRDYDQIKADNISDCLLLDGIKPGRITKYPDDDPLTAGVYENLATTSGQFNNEVQFYIQNTSAAPLVIDRIRFDSNKAGVKLDSVTFGETIWSPEQTFAVNVSSGAWSNVGRALNDTASGPGTYSGAIPVRFIFKNSNGTVDANTDMSGAVIKMEMEFSNASMPADEAHTTILGGFTTGDLYGAGPMAVSVSPDYLLTAYTDPPGEGTLSFNPTSPDGYYAPGTEVWVTVSSSGGGWFFDSWAGDVTGTSNPVMVTMDSDKTVVANMPAGPTLTVNINPPGTGIYCNPYWPYPNGSHEPGTLLDIVAVPENEYTFVNWSGDITDPNDTTSFNIISDMNITANFKDVFPPSPVELLWSRKDDPLMPPPSSPEYADICFNDAGDLYFAGHDSYNNYSGVYAGMYDSSGNIVWDKLIASSGTDEALDLETDPAGNVVILYRLGVDYDLAKYDTTGNEVWTVPCGTNKVGGVAIDATGNIYVSGASPDIDGDTSDGPNDVIVMKYDGGGSHIWTKPVRGFNASLASADTKIVPGPNGFMYELFRNYYVGSSLYKLDSNGNIVWVIDQLSADNLICAGASGTIYLTGEYYSGGSLEDDTRLVRYDEDGNMVSDRIYEYDGYQVPSDIVEGPDGSLFISYMGAIGAQQPGSYSVMKLDHDGELLWSKTTGYPYLTINIVCYYNRLSPDGCLDVDSNGNIALLSASAWLIDPGKPQDGEGRTVLMMHDGDGVAIEGGATSTQTENVTLNLEAHDWGTGVAQMQFSNFTSTGWSGWVNYTTVYPWTLDSAQGNKTVYARYKDVQGNISETFTDDIALGTYVLDADANPAGGATLSFSPTSADSLYAPGTDVWVTVTPELGYSFTNWTGDLTGSPNPVMIHMDGDKSVKANLILTTYTLTAGVDPPGSGTLSFSPSSYGNIYRDGTDVWVTVTPNTGYAFSNWSGAATGSSNPVMVTMDADKTVTASLYQLNTLSAVINPPGTATVEFSPASAGNYYDYGEDVWVTVTPTSGWAFNNWSGGATGTDNPVMVTINGDMSVTANVSDIEPPGGFVYEDLPVGYWPFNVDCRDYSGNFHNITTQAEYPVITSNAKRGGGAASFEDLCSSAYVPDSPDLRLGQNQTVEAWVKWTNASTTGWIQMVGKGDSYGIYTKSSRECMYKISNAAQSYEVTYAGPIYTAWIYLAGTYDGSTIKLYVNGTLVDSKPYSGAVLSDNSSLTFGNALYGYLDEAVIYNRALSADEINDHYNSGVKLPVSVKINDGASTTATLDVTLGLLAFDNVGVSRMQFSNFSSSGWSGWFNYTTVYPWTLESGNGARTVYAQFKDAAGNVSDVYSDNIWLGDALLTADTSPPTSGTFEFSPTSPDGFYAYDTDVWVTVTPDAGYVFTNWSGAATGTANPVMVTMDGDKTVTANLNAIYLLTVSSAPPASGTFEFSPTSPDGYYSPGTDVWVTVTPNTGYVFSNWSGDVTNSANPVMVTMNADKSITANMFVDPTPPTSAITDPLVNQMLSGTTYTIIGTADDGTGSGVQSVEVSTDDGASWQTATDTSGNGSWATWSYLWTLPEDGTYWLIARATDNANNVYTTGYDIYANVDNTPPFTTASPAGAAYNNRFEVTLTSDDFSAIATTYYTIDGTTPTTASPVYSGPIPIGGGVDFPDTAIIDLKFFSIDAQGNVEAIVTETYTITPSPWTRQLGTTTNDYSTSIATDVNGNVFVTGQTDGSIDAQSSAGGTDMFVTKYDASGVKQWTRQLGTTGGDYGCGVSTDADGNVFVAGWTGGPIDGQSSSGGSDVFVTKYNGVGDKLWTSQLGSSVGDYAGGISTDTSGNVYVAGTTSGSFDNQSSAGYSDMFVTKYDSGGTKLWTRQLGTASDDIGYGVATDISGNVYVTGSTYDSIDGQPYAGEYDMFVTKYDSSGVKLWTRQLGSTTWDEGRGISTDTSGNVYVTGWTDGSFDGEPYLGDGDVFVTKYDPSGVKLWTRQFGSVNDEQGMGISTDSDDNICITGYTWGAIDGQSSAGYGDVFVTKYDSSGNRLWTRQFGTTGTDYGYGVSVDTGGSVIVAGETDSAMDGQISEGSIDAIVMKVVAGNPLSDTIPPSSAITAPTDGSNAAVSPQTVTGTAWDADTGIQYVEVSTDGKSTWTFANYSTDGSWSYGWTPPGDGAYEITSRATDNAGNVQTVLDTVNITVGKRLITAYTDPPASGTLGFSPTSPDGYYSPGTDVWVTVTPNAGYVFSNWSGDVTGSANPVMLTMDGDKLVSANMEVLPYHLNINAVPAGSGYAVLDPTYPYDYYHDGDFVTVTPAVNEGWTFEKWVNDDTLQEGTGVGFGVNMTSDKNYSLHFADLTPPNAKPYNVTWGFMEGTANEDRLFDSQLANDGSLYVTGVTFGPLFGETYQGSGDLLLAKYGPAGNLIWAKVGLLPEYDSGYSVAVSNDGSVYVGGITTGSLPRHSNAGGPDAIIMKYDTNGNLLWTAQFGTAGVDGITNIGLDASGNVYATGFTPDYNNDFFIAKYDTDGNELWVNYAGTPEVDEAYGICVDPSGVFYVSGYTDGDLGGYTGSGCGDAFIRKYDTDGNEIWGVLYTGDPYCGERAGDMDLDSEGNIYVRLSTIPAQLAKYDPDGNLIWDTTTDWSYLAGVDDIDVGDDGYVYVTDYVNEYGISRYQALVSKFGRDGKYYWTTALDSYDIGYIFMMTRATGISVDSAGVVYLAGFTSGNMLGGINAGNYDIFIARLEGTSPLMIDNGNTFTTNTSVNLSINMYDAATGLDQMQFSNFSSSGWSGWVNYTMVYPWTLEPGRGTRTVYAQFRDAAGNVSDIYSDDIWLGDALLTADVNPPATGTLSFSPTSPDGHYAYGTDVWVTVTPNAGYLFSNWSGAATGTANTVMVTMDGDRTVTANTEAIYLLTANISPPGSGTLSFSPTSPDGYYISGTDVWVTVTPDPGLAFNGWYGDTNGAANPVMLTIDTDKTITASVGKRDLTHYDWSPATEAAGCSDCHQPVGTFLKSGYTEKPEICIGCHTPSGVGHDRNVGGTGSHPVGVYSPAPGGADLFGAYTGEYYTGLPLFDNGSGVNELVQCVTCHNPMQKTEDRGRTWEQTTTSDNVAYSLAYGPWGQAGYAEPVVYRTTGALSEPQYSRDKKQYMVDKSEFTYNGAAGTIIFGSAQDPAGSVYVTLDYPYLSRTSESNSMCSSCHAEATHAPASYVFNCLDCHAAHNTSNLSLVREDIVPLNLTGFEPGRTVVFDGVSSLADGAAPYNGICEVCHTQTLYHRRDGTGLANHTSTGTDYSGGDCTACHSHTTGFAR